MNITILVSLDVSPTSVCRANVLKCTSDDLVPNLQIITQRGLIAKHGISMVPATGGSDLERAWPAFNISVNMSMALPDASEPLS